MDRTTIVKLMTECKCSMLQIRHVTGLTERGVRMELEKIEQQKKDRAGDSLRAMAERAI